MYKMGRYKEDSIPQKEVIQMKSALEATPLREAYQDLFMIGAAINSWNTEDPAYRALILRHFNSITAENEMKPGLVLDHAKTLEMHDSISTAQDFTRVDKLLSFAKENGIRVRFHVLCWHGQTPIWFFTEGWEDVPFKTLIENGFKANFVSKETLLARQEYYIKSVMTHVNTCFPGVVYCWDVVNEAIEPSQNAPGGFREKSPWYQICGEDFLYAAFRAARKYQAPGQLLFYNDYECYDEKKLECILAVLKKLKEENLADGMGMQAHLNMDHPSMEMAERAARAYASLGLILQVTELDIHCPSAEPEAQAALAKRYEDYFSILVRLKKEGIPVSSATFWGLTDRDSWLTGFRKCPSFPLLFTGEKEIKPAFDAVIGLARK